MFLLSAFCNTSQFSCVISITCRARLSRCYSFLNPFQRIIRVADNEPDEFRRICKQISGGNELKVERRDTNVSNNQMPKPFNWMKRMAREIHGFGDSAYRDTGRNYGPRPNRR